MNFSRVFFILFLTFLALNACNQKETQQVALKPEKQSKFNKVQKDSIIDKYLMQGAWKTSVYSQDWQREIDKGLEVDSTIAYLWQQKAMPLFKQGKYEVGMPYIDKAVKYDRERWQNYRAFIKCIFSNQYKDAIHDFKDYQERYGNGFVMDHSYNFYIALSYLQLNEFEKAEQLFEKEYHKTLENKGEGWLHHLDLFYYGISCYEQKKYEKALKLFNKALVLNPKFSDVQYYKAICLYKLEKPEQAKIEYKTAKENAKNGYTINEDNAIYERYPYQVRWP